MITGAGKVGVSFAGPGGIILGPGAPTVLVEGSPISVAGDEVTPHGENLHAKPNIDPTSCALRVLAMGKPVTVMTASKATCIHPVMAGSPTVIVNPK